MKNNVIRHSLMTDQDIYYFKEGTHARLYEKLGAHPVTVKGEKGTHFAVWAPNARRVSVIGDFNGWNTGSHVLQQYWPDTGILEGFIPGVSHGSLYKYRVESMAGTQDKGDPFAFFWEMPPGNSSIVHDIDWSWTDDEWLASRKKANALDSAISIYEVHLGSWRRSPEKGNAFLNYRELADQLVSYLRQTNFTHVEFLPVMEHPFYGSWGYQTLGYFAPTARYGTPQDFMYLVNELHKSGIGVILDWVPSHFPSDSHGLAQFDGTYLYEHMDPRLGFHPDWKSSIFNYGRNEVRSFLTSSANFWIDRYHADGLRVDAVASMLYLDYSRKSGEWIPNRYGGRENLEAIEFLKQMNRTVHELNEGVLTIAEESTAWPMVTRPAEVGGLGFDMKWNMGWMHDILSYFSQDPIHRKYHHDNLTFSIWYAFSENFLLPLSHDEVVHGKGSLLGKMPGDDWQKFANLRLLMGYMYSHPGKKLLFMGSEIGQWSEWNHDTSLDWHLTEFEPHQRLQRWVEDLNALYRGEPALFRQDTTPEGFSWVDFRDWESSVISFLRKAGEDGPTVLAVCNFTPVARHNYRIGVPKSGFWKEIINSDAKDYGGSGQGNFGGIETTPVPYHGFEQSLSVVLPPLSIVLFKGPDKD
ncbi:MAG: 1,4-alpha-glucan branching enzyme [Synergistales bacterium]|nr:1,4-alpha-glucan branching enzyme [Synergistales bacterium]